MLWILSIIWCSFWIVVDDLSDKFLAAAFESEAGVACTLFRWWDRAFCTSNMCSIKSHFKHIHEVNGPCTQFLKVYHGLSQLSCVATPDRQPSRRAAFHQQFLIILTGTQEITGQHGVLQRFHAIHEVYWTNDCYLATWKKSRYCHLK